MGIGAQLAEEIEKEFPQITGCAMQSEDKERMAVSVKRRLEGKSLQLPDDRDLISDIHSIRRIVTQGNKVRFEAPRTSKGHADRFWALALAVDSATTEVAPRIAFV
jgi:phage FluMu gp28-like protein